METIKVKTESGFECEVDKNIGDDWDMLEVLAKITSGDPSDTMLATVNLANLMLGKEQMDRLKKHCKNESGRPSTKKMTAEVLEIFNSIGKESKNS